MFDKQVVKIIACLVLVSYCSLCTVSHAIAAELPPQTTTPLLLAQVVTSTTGQAFSVEEERAQREIFLDKIQRLEAEMNDARGTRKTLMTTAVSTIFIGAGIIGAVNTVRGGVEDIPVEGEEEDNKEQALEAMDALQTIGGGIIGAGLLSLLGYLTYTALISGKQQKIDALREELNVRFQMKGLTPEYLQNKESTRVVLDEIAQVKKSAGTARGFQSFFSRLGIGSLLSGGFLVGVSSVANNVIDEMNIDENDPDERAARDDAIDKADTIGTTGYVLLGVGGVSIITSFIFGRRAAGKENRIDELENGLLRIANRINIEPRLDGFMVMYTYHF